MFEEQLKFDEKKKEMEQMREQIRKMEAECNRREVIDRLMEESYKSVHKVSKDVKLELTEAGVGSQQNKQVELRPPSTSSSPSQKVAQVEWEWDRKDQRKSTKISELMEIAAELEHQLAKMNKSIYDRVKIVASSKGRVQVLKEDMNTKDLVIQQLAGYFNDIFECTNVDYDGPGAPTKETRSQLVPFKPLSLMKANLDEEEVEQLMAELRAKLSLNSDEEPLRNKYEYECTSSANDEVMYSRLVEHIARLKDELACSKEKIADLDSMSMLAHAEETHLSVEIELRNQLLKELVEALDRMRKISGNLQAGLAALGCADPISLFN